MREIRDAKILFINNDRDESNMVEFFLRERRNDMVVTCDANNQSLSDFRGEEPDLILIMAQWKFEALQLYRELRTIPEFEKTPVIFWRFVEASAEFYPMAQKIGVAGCIEYVYDIEKDFLVARDTVLAGGAFYPD